MSALARSLFQRNGPAPRDFPPTDTPPGTPGSTQPVTPRSEDAMTREPSQAASTSATPALASTSRDPVDPRHIGAQPFTNDPSTSDPHALARGLSSMRPGPPRFVDGAPTQASAPTSTSTTPTAAPAPSLPSRLSSRLKRASAPLKSTIDHLTSPLASAFSTLASALSTLPDVTLTLENSGSVARDHLASERTFLAYTRTSLVIASTGVALVQLFTISAETRASDSSSSSVAFQPTSPRLARWARPLGAATVAFGIFVLAVGLARYLTIQSALVRGIFPAARLVVVAISIGLCVLVGVVFGGVVGGG